MSLPFPGSKWLQVTLPKDKGAGHRKKWIWILVLLSSCVPWRESLGLSEPVATYEKWWLKIAILKNYWEDLKIVWEDMQKPPCLVPERNKFLLNGSFFIILSLYLKAFFYWWQGVRVISHLSETVLEKAGKPLATLRIPLTGIEILWRGQRGFLVQEAWHTLGAWSSFVTAVQACLKLFTLKMESIHLFGRANEWQANGVSV